MKDGKKVRVKTNPKEDMFEIIHVLADSNRMQILSLLAESGEMCARDLLMNFPITQPTLSHHMSVLLENHLVEARKSGRWVFYRLSPNGIQQIIDYFKILKDASSGSGSAVPQKAACQSLVPVHTKRDAANVLPAGINLHPDEPGDIPYGKKEKKKDRDKISKKEKKKKKNHKG